MIRCAHCGRENDDRFSFCLDCGKDLRGQPSAASRTPIKLTRPAPPTAMAPAAEAPVPSPTPVPSARTCPSCHAPVPETNLFCGACGARLAPAEPQGGTRLMHSAEAAAAPRFRLVGLESDGRPGPTFPLGAERTVLGRAEGDVRLPDDPHVSPAHAAFEVASGHLVADDLGSTTGTWLRVPGNAPVRVGPGDALRVGGQLLGVERMPPPSETQGAPRIWGSPDPGYLLRLVQQLDGFVPGRIWPLAPGDHAIGREAGEITFPADGYVSGRHAHLVVGEDGHGTFEDLGSSNGSYLRLRGPTKLEPGDLLLVGTHLLRVEVG